MPGWLLLESGDRAAAAVASSDFQRPAVLRSFERRSLAAGLFYLLQRSVSRPGISDIRLFECRSFLHSLFRIPTALSLADVDHLPDVVGVMRSDARYGGVPRLQLLLIGGFDLALPGGHHLVQLPDGAIPPAAIKAGKGLVVVIELADRLPTEPS